MKIPIVSQMPKTLVKTFIGLFIVGLVCFIVSLQLSEIEHGEYWTALLLHGVAEFCGFALGILVTFWIGVRLAEEKIKQIVRFVAKLRKDDVIRGETARGIVMCAAKVFSEEKLTKDLSISILHKPDKCDVCVLDINIRGDRRCQYCGLLDHVWKIPPEEEVT